MNKTKILTSLSALAAVFVFNGDAMAAGGVFNPTCFGNEYSITVNYDDGYQWTPSDDGSCDGTRGASDICYPIAMPSCPADDYMFMYVYGESDVDAPSADCSGSHSYTGWRLQALEVKVNKQVVNDFQPVDILAGAEIKDDHFKYNGVPVDTGSTFELVPYNVQPKTVNVQFVCTYENDGLPTSVAPTNNTHGGGNVGDDIVLSDYCTAGGYTVNTWQYKSSMSTTWANIDGTVFKIPGIGDATSATIQLRPAKYNPNTYDMMLMKGENGNTTHKTLKYTNPVEDADGTWKEGTSSITTVTLPTLSDYTLRAMTTVSTGVVGNDSSALSGELITRSSLENNTSAKLPNLGVVTAGRTYYPAWAKNCEESPSATCELELNLGTGVVTYINECKPGFNLASGQ